MFDVLGAIFGLTIAFFVLTLLAVLVGGSLALAGLLVVIVLACLAALLLLPLAIPVLILAILIALPVWLIRQAARSPGTAMLARPSANA